MAGIRGKSGPPGNQNAFRHGLACIAQRCADGVLNPAEQTIREEILAGLLADKSEAAQISTAMRVLAEIIASDVSLLMTFNHAIDGVLQEQSEGENQSEGAGSIGRLQKTAGEFSIGQSSAVWDGTDCKGREPAGNHRQMSETGENSKAHSQMGAETCKWSADRTRNVGARQRYSF